MNNYEVDMFILKPFPVGSEAVYTTVIIATACPTAAMFTLFALNFNKNASIVNYFKLTDVVRGTAPSAERSVIGNVVDSNNNLMYDSDFKYLTTGRMYWVSSVNKGLNHQ